MRKIVVFLFLLFMSKLIFPNDIELIDIIQKNLNINRFSEFVYEHYYSDGSYTKTSKKFIDRIDNLQKYKQVKLHGILQGDKSVYENAHSELLENVITDEKTLDNFLKRTESSDDRILFLDFLKDLRTSGIEDNNPMVLEKLQKIDVLINEIRYLPPVLPSEDQYEYKEKIRKRKIFLADDAFEEVWEFAETEWFYGRNEHYLNKNPGAALPHYLNAFSKLYSFFGNVAPDDIIRIDFFGTMFDFPFTSLESIQMYPWVCEDLCICYYDLKLYDSLIKQDKVNLGIFAPFARNYNGQDGDEYPGWDGLELEYVPGYFTYVGYREKKEYLEGISKLDSYRDWKNGYWNGYKSLLYLFIGDNNSAISNVDIALPLLLSQSAIDLEQYKSEIDEIKECKAAASKSKLIYQQLKSSSPASKYFQFWTLSEGYCFISESGYSQAIALLKEIRNVSWKKAANFYIAYCYFKLGDYVNCEKHLKIVLSLDSNHQIDICAHFLHGRLFEDQGMIQQAFEKYSFIVTEYGNNTDVDVKHVVILAQEKLSSMYDFTVVNMSTQEESKGFIGVNQEIKLEVKKSSDFVGIFEWSSSSSKIKVKPVSDTVAIIEGIKKSSSLEDVVITVLFKNNDGLEIKKEVRFTCFDVKLISCDNFYPHDSNAIAEYKYEIEPDISVLTTFLIEKDGVPGFEITDDTGEINWTGLYNGSNAPVGNYDFVLKVCKENGIVEITDSLTVFDVSIKGKGVIYLDSSSLYEAVTLLDGTYNWTGSSNVIIISPSSKTTDIRGNSLGSFELSLSFTPTGSKLSATDSLSVTVKDPISISLTKPTLNPILMNIGQRLEYSAKAVHVQGEHISGDFNWSCNLGTFSGTSFSNVSECTTSFTAETIGTSSLQITFTSDNRVRTFERPIYVDKHIAIPSFTFFPSDDVQLDIEEVCEFSVECRYNGDVIEKIGEWYDISDTLKYRVVDLTYSDPKNLLVESDSDISLPVRKFKAIKHGKSTLTALINYEIEKKVKGKWLRIAFSKKHEHVFRVVPNMEFKINALRRLFKKNGLINKTTLSTEAFAEGKRIKIGQRFEQKGYQFELISLQWETKIGKVVPNPDKPNEAKYTVPLDLAQLDYCSVIGLVKIIDKNSDIDIIEVKSKKEKVFAVIDSLFKMSLDPGVNSETVAGVVEFFKIKNINVSIPLIEFSKDIGYEGNLELTSIYDIPLKLKFSWLLYFDVQGEFEAENKFDYSKKVDETWVDAHLVCRFNIGGIEWYQNIGDMNVFKPEKVIDLKIIPDNFATVAGRSVDLEMLITGAPTFDVLDGNYQVAVKEYNWFINDVDQHYDDKKIIFNPDLSMEGKDVKFTGKASIVVTKKGVEDSATNPIWISEFSNGKVCELKIVKPNTNKIVLHDGIHPNAKHFTLEFFATTGNVKLDKEIKWEVPLFKSVNEDIVPDSLMGNTINITYYNFPYGYDEYGQKKIKVKINEKCRKEMDVEFFYSFTGESHPYTIIEKSEPNCFYYYKQVNEAKKADAPHEFYLKYHRYPFTDEYGYWDFEENDGPYDPYTSKSTIWIPLKSCTHEKGLLGFASVIQHENTHEHDFYEYVWSGVGFIPDEDEDKDRLRDSWELDHSEEDYTISKETVVEDKLRYWKYAESRGYAAQNAYLTAEENENLNQLDWSTHGPHFIERKGLK